MRQQNTIRVGTRASKLALIQTEMVVRQLQSAGHKVETVVMQTRGDRILNRSLIDFGGKGAFVTEFENALLEGRIDLAVHSAKDMPVQLADGLQFAGVLPRADARDVLVYGAASQSLEERLKKVDVPGGNGHPFRVGTGSSRRQFQLLENYPNVKCVPLRGNVPTRLEKVRNGELDAVVLAAAGLSRLSLDKEPEFGYRYFSIEEMIPCAGQGIIVVEGRKGDAVSELVLSDRSAMWELETERKVLELFGAGCHDAIGVKAQVLGEEITLCVIRKQGDRIWQQVERGRVEKRLELAEQIWEKYI